MRIMAVDLGDQRTGVAVSDLTGSIAGETFVIQEWSPDRLADTIAGEARRRDVSRVVLGYPRNMDGSEGPRAEKSAAFAELLRQRGLDVVLWDERLTTVDAHRILNETNVRGKKRRKTVDAVAAALILESYLNSRPSQGGPSGGPCETAP